MLKSSPSAGTKRKNPGEDGSTKRSKMVSSVAAALPNSAVTVTVTTSFTYTAEDLSKKTIPELKELCKARNLPVTGTKPRLIDLLLGGNGNVVAAPVAKALAAPAKAAATPKAQVAAVPKAQPKPKPVTAAAPTVQPMPKPSVAPAATKSNGKQTARKSSGSKNPPSAKYQAATTTNANQRLPRNQYVIVSTFGYPPSHFHSYMGPPDTTIHGIMDTLEDANKAVEHVFANKHDYCETSYDHMRRDHTFQMKKDAYGCLQMKVNLPDSEEWRVWAVIAKDSEQLKLEMEGKAGSTAASVDDFPMSFGDDGMYDDMYDSDY
ncbi:hypothetical protein HDU97_007090 [Phlyctochytrium planicorne]|nr:hypothetical protein HDU97_007090 [Phlyctochytrium planicorne]